MKPSPSAPERSLEAVLVLWDRLSALLGTATTSALLRRALAQVSSSHPVLHTVQVERDGLSFVCRMENPPPGEHAQALASLGRTLSLLLHELTGPVVIRYLAADSELAAFQFVGQDE